MIWLFVGPGVVVTLFQGWVVYKRHQSWLASLTLEPGPVRIEVEAQDGTILTLQGPPLTPEEIATHQAKRWRDVVHEFNWFCYCMCITAVATVILKMGGI